MKLAGYYLKLQVKESIRVLPIFFASIFLMILFLAAGILFASYIAEDASSFTKVNVAIVIPDGNETSKQVLSLIHSMENVNAVCDFFYMTKDMAEKGIQDGIIDVELLISPDFYDDVNTGVNSPVTVRMAKNGRLESTVFKELLTDGVQLVQITEASVYGAGYALRQFDMRSSIPEMEELFTEIYVSRILQRGDTFSQIMLSPVGEQKLSQYYISAVMLMIAVMTGICFGFLYQRTEFQIVRLLWGRGLSPMVVSIMKTLTIALQLWILIMLCNGVLWVCSVITESSLVYADLSIPVKMFRVCFSMAAYFHMIYSCFSKSGKGGFVIFIGNVLMCIFSGILIPLRGLPSVMAAVQQFIPFTVWQEAVNETLFGSCSLLVFVKTFIMTIMFEMIGAFCLCRKV